MVAPHFHTLTVSGLHRTTQDAVVLTLGPDLPAEFSFEPGQYLTLRRQIDGVEIRRSYSICAGRQDGFVRVGIKHVPGGAFSGWANTALSVGDQIEAMPPMGRFTLPKAPLRNGLFVAGGSGITPILSLVKSLLSEEPRARATLLYANRSLSSIMFRDEIEDLKNLHMDRLRVIHVLESGQDIPLFSGRLDAAKSEEMFRSWVPVSDVERAYLCGPAPMRASVEAALLAAGLPPKKVAQEVFASARSGTQAKLTPTGPAPDGIEAHVTLGGVSQIVTISPGQSLLEAALNADLDAPFACTAGVCSTCRAKITEGRVEMRANHALEEAQVRDGYILTCQSHAIAGPIRVDYDA